MTKGLTEVAHKYVMELITTGKKAKGNPFVYKDDKMYMLYDSITISNGSVIKNSMERNGATIAVKYYWNRQAVYVNFANGMSLEPDGKTLTLNGIEGAMLMANTEQFEWNDKDITAINIDYIAGQLKLMTDVQISIMKKEGSGKPDSIFKTLINEEVDSRKKTDRGFS